MIEPYAEALQLDRYGGYVVGCNGHHIINAQSGVRAENASIDVPTSARLFAFAKKHHLTVSGRTSPRILRPCAQVALSHKDSGRISQTAAQTEEKAPGRLLRAWADSR
jgi:hypothetical protein